MSTSETSSVICMPSPSPQRLKRSWSMGSNTCHAPMVMRSDLQDHLRRSREELGFRHWRAHGTLSDDVAVFSLSADGKPQYTFSGLKRILDVVLGAGLKPFLELSFMPAALARDPKQTLTHYRGITSPPLDFQRWEELVRAVADFLLQTYGADEVRSWIFEVWNEPNIPFWQGTQAEYCTLYHRAARAIKSVHPALRVGGPATARAEWVAEFLDFCIAQQAPVDFLSTHIYPSDLAFLDAAEGDVDLLGMDFLHRHFARVHAEVNARFPGLPIYWGEWNSSAGPLAENHDTCENAAVISAALAGIERWADGSLFWNLSDIYEECQFHFSPFHGGYGLLTVDSLPKAAFRAFEFFERLESHHLPLAGGPDTAERGALGSISGDGRRMSVLLWNTCALGEWSCALQVPDTFHPVSLERILPGRGSAYEAWIALGRPLNLTPEHDALLQAASTPATDPDWDGVTLSLPPGTVAFARFETSPLACCPS